MNSRQRFQEVMAYGSPDRVPFFEEGIRADVIKTWQGQGLPPGTSLTEMFSIDERVELAPDLLPGSDLKKWPAGLDDLKGYRRSLDASDPSRMPENWADLATALPGSGKAILMRVHRGLYQTLGVAGWRRFAEVNLLLKDDPQLVRHLLEIQAEFAAELVGHILSAVEIDGAIFSEPISGNSGPLISPRMFDECAAISYEPILKVLREHGVETIIFRTYANTRLFLPIFIKRGFNCLWACETPEGTMEYDAIRREYGRDLRLVGGIDVDVLRQDEEAIRRELLEKVPPLLQDGGFIPLADGRVRRIVPYDNYVYYRALLGEIVGQEKK